MTGIDLPPLRVIALAVTGLWLLAAFLMPLLAQRFRGRATVVLIALGVPILGWLTLLWGPGIGVASFALGVLALIARPLGRRGGPVVVIPGDGQHP